MKKIAILTFQTACNYGAVLQAYSLQEFISSQEGFEGRILDYRSKRLEERNKVTAASLIKGKGNPLKKTISYLLCCGDLSKRDKVFNAFRSKYFKIEREALKKEDLESTNEVYDAFIVGSDQVWNKDIIKDDNSYFLDFVKDKNKKYSYAASIGKTSLSDTEEKEFIDLVSSFHRISIRENDIIDDLSSKMKRAIDCTLDPVFLYGSENWRKLSSYSKRKPYVLFFMMGTGSQSLPALGFAKKVAKERNIDILYLSDQERWFKFRDTIHFGVASPNEFLGLIDNAELVVTNSFHATAFSIILHTPFFTETAVLRNNRILTLLEIADLKNCGLTKGEPAKAPRQITDLIDWNHVDSRVNKEVNKSKEYLYSVLSDLK